MKTVTLYECEICGTRYGTDTEAWDCEAQGKPEIPAWLSARVGQEVAGFGDCGVVTAVLESITIGMYHDKHTVLCDTNMWLGSHQGDVDLLPVSWLDPMGGLDFLRYVTPPAPGFRDIIRWAEWCGAYGIEPDPTRALWWAICDDEKRAAILDVLRKAGAA